MKVDFLSTIGFCELSCETRTGLYTLRFLPDGRIQKLFNLKQVDYLPVTPTTRKLNHVANQTQSDDFQLSERERHCARFAGLLAYP